MVDTRTADQGVASQVNSSGSGTSGRTDQGAATAGGGLDTGGAAQPGGLSQHPVVTGTEAGSGESRTTIVVTGEAAQGIADQVSQTTSPAGGTPERTPANVAEVVSPENKSSQAAELSDRHHEREAMSPVQGRVLPLPVIRYGTHVLPVQPVIMSGSPFDLAATLPSAPAAPTKDPAKSTGLLGSLTQQLVGVVVPVFSLVFLIARGQVALWLLMLILVFLAGIRLGLMHWLRRAGFAHAARSDALLFSFFSFATPHRWDYAWASATPHSPVFVVADSKILAT